jgi:hypothetical protein
MKPCIRPHCAIRSHNHERMTFAKYHNYLPKFCDIANRYSLDDKDLIKKYVSLTDCTIEKSQMNCVQMFRDMLSDIEAEIKGSELKKLRILYLFTIISSPVGTLLRIKNPKLADIIDETYQRLLIEGKNDKEFITQIVFIYRKM